MHRPRVFTSTPFITHNDWLTEWRPSVITLKEPPCCFPLLYPLLLTNPPFLSNKLNLVEFLLHLWLLCPVGSAGTCPFSLFHLRNNRQGSPAEGSTDFSAGCLKPRILSQAGAYTDSWGHHSHVVVLFILLSGGSVSQMCSRLVSIYCSVVATWTSLHTDWRNVSTEPTCSDDEIYRSYVTFGYSEIITPALKMLRADFGCVVAVWEEGSLWPHPFSLKPFL